MRLRSRAEAQQRADQIIAFRAELDELAEDEVLNLHPEQQRAIEKHHQHLLRQLTLGFDIDTSKVVTEINTAGLERASAVELGTTKTKEDTINQSVSKLSQLKGK